MNIRKIGIDFHGVLNENPQFFRKMIDAALAQKIEVHIITGGPRDTIERYLAENKINYTRLWCIFDFYKEQNLVTFAQDGSFSIDDELWNKAKAEYCRAENILLHIDDSLIYGNYFPSTYCLYNHSTKTCTLHGKTINFDADPEKVLQILMCNV